MSHAYSKFRKIGVGVIALTLLYLVGTFIPSPTKASQGPTQVSVTNFPATQPVSGAISVSNFPSTQPVSGTVNVGNFPAFPSTQTVAGTVSVGNLPTTQNVKNIDEKGRNPYMQGAFANCVSGTSAFCDMTFPAVPANKRLVIEHVSANVGANTGTGVNGTFLLVGGVVFSLPARAGATPTLLGVNEPVIAYCEAGQSFTYRVVWNAVTGTGAVSSVVSGYLVDLTQ